LQSIALVFCDYERKEGFLKSKHGNMLHGMFFNIGLTDVCVFQHIFVVDFIS